MAAHMRIQAPGAAVLHLFIVVAAACSCSCIINMPPSTARRASLPFALMGTSVAISQVVAAPLAAGLLRLDGVAGLAGW